jgi:SAM-dependent methyltransferase
MPWSADAWNDWYSNQAKPSQRDSIISEALGLPPGLTSNNLLPGDAAHEVMAALEVGAGDVLLDLACGRGAWGLELARRSGARLIGVHWSTTALVQARRRAEELGMTATVQFREGDLTGSGLADESVDAVVCIDSVQFVRPPLAVVQEAYRVLRPGGRFVATTWEPIHGGDPSLHPACSTATSNATSSRPASSPCPSGNEPTGTRSNVGCGIERPPCPPMRTIRPGLRSAKKRGSC